MSAFGVAATTGEKIATPKASETAARRLPRLRSWLAVVILIVLVPNLVVIMAALLHSGRSFREVSLNRLEETVRVLAQSTASELNATERLLVHYTNPNTPGVAPAYSLQTAVLNGSDYMAYRVPETWENEPNMAAVLPKGVQELTRRAFETRHPQISNILEGQVRGAPYAIVIAIPVELGSGERYVAAILATPRALIQSLRRGAGEAGNLVLAVTDGDGRIIGRSVDGEQFVGRTVPDWDKLQATGLDQGTFRAQTIEGASVVFAFQKIPGTPGWVAVAGENEASFDARWQGPIRSMVVVSLITLVVGVVLSLSLLRRIMRPITALAERAQDVSKGAGETFDLKSIPPSGIAEVETLRSALSDAQEVMNLRLVNSRAAERRAQKTLTELDRAERLARMGRWSYVQRDQQFQLSNSLSQMLEMPTGTNDFELIGLSSLLSMSDFDRLGSAIQDTMLEQSPFNLTLRILAPTRSFTAEVRGDVMRNLEGQVIGVTGTLQDVEERTEQNARLEALADNLPRGLIMRITRDENRHLSINYLSGGVETLTGHSAEQILANPTRLVVAIGDDYRGDLIRFLRDADEAGTVLDRAFPLMTADGQEIWLRGRAALRLQEGGHAVWDGVILDISAERQATEAMREAKLAAEAAERAKGDFLAAMSHEIRTPMNSVIGMARLALRTELDQKQRRYLQRIDDSANVLLGIINDILDFSRIEAGAMPLEDAPFRLESVLETVASINAIMAEQKGIELTFDLGAGVPNYLMGDSLRLGQVLTNLVGNAVKFTESGDIVVRVRHQETAEDGRMRLLFSVRDSGIGISEEHMRNLFRPFSQADTDTARKFGGTGLGLAISRQIVELMNGEIWVESVEGLGSTFSFTAEFGPVEEGSRADPSSMVELLKLNDRRVLVVDDNAAARGALSEMIEGFGAHVQAADSGAEALILLRGAEGAGQPFDIMMLDWRMPGMDGIELAHQIRADRHIRHMPAILMVTAYSQELAMNEVSGLGFHDVLVKPVTPSLVFNALITAISATPRPVAPAPLTSGRDLTGAAARLKGRRVLVVDDNALNREVASEFLHLVGVEVFEAVNGRDAIDQMNDMDFDVVLMDVHMPVMNGLEAIREIRERREWAELPVIALTAQARQEDADASRAAGMSDHLTKPIDERLLYHKLVEMIESHHAKKAAAGKTTAPAAPEADAVAATPAGGIKSKAAKPARALKLAAPEPEEEPRSLLERFGGAPERLTRFLDGFMRDFSAMEAETAALYEAKDDLGLAEYIHRLRGVVGYLGLDALQLQCGDVEVAAREADRVALDKAWKKMPALMADCLALIAQARIDVEKAIAARDAKVTDHLSPLAALAIAQTALAPVIAGDFAAVAPLNRLKNHLASAALRHEAEVILEQFEDLNTQDAEAGLRALIAKMEQEAKS